MEIGTLFAIAFLTFMSVWLLIKNYKLTSENKILMEEYLDATKYILLNNRDGLREPTKTNWVNETPNTRDVDKNGTTTRTVTSIVPEQEEVSKDN